jgi:hypothetical protein
MGFFYNKISISLALFIASFGCLVKSKPCKPGPTFPPISWEIKPFVLVPGKCPENVTPAKCPSQHNDECYGDAKCKSLHPGKQLKCCEHKCDFRCVPMPQFQLNPGKCPVFSSRADCSPRINDTCHGDVDCNKLHPGQGLKCCKDGCDFKCVPKIYITPGTCPIFSLPEECPPEPDNECKDDANCKILYPGLVLKCCKDGCDLRCMPPIPPPTTYTPAPTKTLTTIKLSTIFTLPGECPSFPFTGACPREPDNECVDDKECLKLFPALGFKCCKHGCKRMCTPPLFESPLQI